MNDEELVELCKQGEEGAFEELIKRYHSSIYNYIYNMVGDKQLSEDLVQETFIKLINNIEKYKRIFNVKFSTWVFKIAKNIVNDEFRRQKNRNSISIDEKELMIADDLNVESEAILNEEIKSINDCLDKLSQEARSMVYFRYYMNLSYKEIGEILSCSENKVKWKLHDAIDKVRKLIKAKEVNTNET